MCCSTRAGASASTLARGPCPQPCSMTPRAARWAVIWANCREPAWRAPWKPCTRIPSHDACPAVLPACGGFRPAGLALAGHAEELPAPIKAVEARGAQIVGTFPAPAGLLVGLLRADSAARSAALLREPRPAAALAAHESAGKASTLKPLGEITAPLQRHLDDNLEWMSELDAMAMPAISTAILRGADVAMQIV